MARKRALVCTGGCGKSRQEGPNFYLDSKGLPREKCKECTAKEAAIWRRNNPEKHRAIYQRNNHKSNLRLRFGITIEQYNILVAQSDGLCSICREPESRDRRLSLDHDHESGEIRGFLCCRCNLLLGNIKDNIKLLQGAVEYLRTRGSQKETPVPMILPCPACGKRHIDKGVFATKLHVTHACQFCGMCWRPAVVATVGVDFLPGFKDIPEAPTSEKT